MSYTVEKLEKSHVKLVFDIDAETFSKAVDAAYNKTRHKYSIPGFRKGHVPKKVIEGIYGKEVFFEDAMDIVIPEAYSEALDKETDFEVVAQPTLTAFDFKEDGGATFTLTVAVKPEVKLGAYTGIKIRKAEYTVKDEDVEADLRRLQERNSRLVAVEGRPAENGDTATIDFSGSVNGEKFEGGTSENYPLVLGSGSFIPGFEEQVVGMNVGEEKDVQVKFPEDYQAEELKGKDAVFAVKLNKLEKKELPEVNDEFIKDAAGAESVDAYKKEVRERLEKQAKQRADAETEDNIVRAITAGAEVEIPDAMIESQMDAMVQSAEYRLSAQYGGMKLEDYLRYMGSNLADFREGYRAHATEQVKSQLVIDKIVRQEKIAATEEEVDAKLEEFAKAAGKSLEEYKKESGATQREYIENEIVVDKLFAFLRENNDLSADAEEAAAKPAAKKPAAKKTAAKKAAAAADEGAAEQPAEAPAAKKPRAKKAAPKTDAE